MATNDLANLFLSAIQTGLASLQGNTVTSNSTPSIPATAQSSLSTASSNPLIASPNLPNVPPNSPNVQQSNILGNISGPPPIQPYVSLHVPPVSAGHPSLTSLVSSSSTMPFTGLSSLGVSTGMPPAVVTTQVSRAQVNAYRRDSATRTLPVRKKRGRAAHLNWNASLQLVWAMSLPPVLSITPHQFVAWL